MDMVIRTASDEDADAIAAFNVAMARETEHRELNLDVVRRGVRGLLDRPHFGFYLVATVAGQVVASLMVTYEWSDWRNGCFWWIQSLYVVPEYRRRGVFRQMYAHLEEATHRDEMACGLRLYVEESNALARRTYETLGLALTRYTVYESVF